MKLNLTLKNNISELDRLQGSIEEFLTQNSFSESMVFDLNLLAEEILVNIINHGYQGRNSSRADIHVQLELCDNRKVVIKVRDSAPAFNPLLVEERNPEDERIGGWGIPMLRTLSDRLEYARQGNENVLTITRSERDS